MANKHGRPQAATQNPAIPSPPDDKADLDAILKKLEDARGFDGWGAWATGGQVSTVVRRALRRHRLFWSVPSPLPQVEHRNTPRVYRVHPRFPYRNPPCRVPPLTGGVHPHPY